MDEAQLAEFLDQQRWLLNSGLVPDSVKNQLFMLGSVVHPDVQAVELKIRPEVKTVDYTIYLRKDLIKKMELYKELSTATSTFGLWRFKRFLKKEGSLNFSSMMNTFVRDFCGPGWSASVAISDFDAYIDSIGVEGEPGGPSQQSDQPSN
jgi:hypothetical protein